MTNLCDVPIMRRHGILSACDIIVHINRAVTDVTGEMEESPVKRARVNPKEQGVTGDPPVSEDSLPKAMASQ